MLSLFLRTPSSSPTLVYSHYVAIAESVGRNSTWKPEPVWWEHQDFSPFNPWNKFRLWIESCSAKITSILTSFLHDHCFFLFFSPSNKCYIILPSAFVSAFFQHTIDFHLSLICIFLSRFLMPTVYFSGVKRKWHSFWMPLTNNNELHASLNYNTYLGL